MDDLTKLCDELEKCKKKRSCYANEIVCTKAKLKCYIDGDVNKILKLKAQIKIRDNYTQGDIGVISLIVSVITLCLSIFSEISGGTSIEYILYSLYGLIALLIITLISLWGKKKYGYRDKWKRYIEVVLQDIDKL